MSATSWPDITDFTELFAETLARVRARFDADANAGLTEDDPAWIDTREGSFYWDVTQPPAMEIARLWDAMTETAAAAFPSTAWGDYLDDHGLTFNLTRIPASYSVGTLVFVARSVTQIAVGTQVSSVASQTGEVVSFATTESGTTCALLGVPENVQVTAADEGGTLTAATRYYHVTALNEFGETTGSADVAATTTTDTGLNTIEWDPVMGAASYQVYVSTEQNTLGQLVGSTFATLFIDDGAISPSGPEPQINTTSGIALAAAAVQSGTTGNVAAGAVASLDTVLPTIYSVTNPDPFIGGDEEESDDDFRVRIMGEYLGTAGGGNVADYRRWVVGQGVERVSVIPVWDGPGTVLVIVMLQDGSPVLPTVVTNIQQFLDPVAGQGAGQAPIGASVTVTTSTLVPIDIAGIVIPVDGYSLDGENNTIATRNSILSALTTYLRSLEPGSVVVYEHVQACFFVPGVFNISGVTINGLTDDIPLAGTTDIEYLMNGTFTGDVAGSEPAGWVTDYPAYVDPGASVSVDNTPLAPNGRSVTIITNGTGDQGIACDAGILPAGTYRLSFNLLGITGPDLVNVVVGSGAMPSSATLITLTMGWGERSQVQFTSNGTDSTVFGFRCLTDAAISFGLADVSIRSTTVQVPRLGQIGLSEP